MAKQDVSLEENKTPKMKTPAADDDSAGVLNDSILDKDDSFDDDDDDDDDDWDLTDSFHEQERGAELSQIEAFLNQTLMVRCERYNANLTSISCRRKKESPPPRLKNAVLSEEENMQNHPCYACVGPIIVNWNIDESPIALYEVEKQKVIVHPGLEDDFTAARARQIEQYREQSKAPIHPGVELVEQGEAGPPAPIVINEDDKNKRGRRGRHEKTKAAHAAEKAPTQPIEAPQAEAEQQLDLGLQAKDEVVAEEVEAKTPEVAEPEKAKKAKKAKAKPAKADKEPETEAEAPEEDKAKKAKPKTAAKKSAKKATKSEAKTTKSKSKAKPKSDADHDPCASCGREYTSKHWRGDLCNPCYAKKLRERKKKQENKTKTKAPPAAKTESHPPCTSCGREYTPKHWRGEICNPCYAKKLRERKKKQKAKK